MVFPDLIQSKATLVAALYSDIVTHDGIFKNHKMFFIKDEATREFCGIYKTIDNDWINKDTDDYRMNQEYQINHLKYLLGKRLIYMLSTNNNENDFQFKLYLKKADEFDMFYSPSFLKLHKIYYVINPKDNSVTGPEFINTETQISTINSLIEKGLIYTPNNRQSFEPFKSKQSA